MLESWSVDNFKSFFGETELSLKPLTLICGANSSGKSSIIQSILLIKQTIQQAPTSRAIALNGPLVRLGAFSDIENFHAKSNSSTNSVGFGWSIKRNQKISPSASSVSTFEDEVDSVSINFKFDSGRDKKDSGTSDLHPALKYSRISASYRDLTGFSHDMSVSISRNSGKGRKLFFKTSILDEISDVFAFRVSDIDPETKSRAIESKPKAKIAGCLTKHFYPIDLVIRYDRAQELSKLFCQALSGNRSLAIRRLATQKLVVPSTVRDLILPVVESIVLDSQKSSFLSSRVSDSNKILSFIQSDQYSNASQFLTLIQGINPVTKRQFRERITPHIKKIEDLTYRHIGQELTIAPARVDLLTSASQQNDSYFKFAVRYLGPLRDEPRPLYPLQALSSPTDVGPKGELTAAVLHLNEKRLISYVPSRCFGLDCVNNQIETVKFRDAVEDWLSYLGVASAFETSEKGKFGHELRIKTSNNGDFQDLTNVGVGVSQVLPIVVTCLLAPRGSTIILEQPELHLHPAVQARLADFFVSMTISGKQCLIETHGEHLIERIRFRIAADLSDTIIDDTIIYSFEHLNGRTLCKKIPLNKYGAIQDWPEDFFDQSQKEAERIVMKALERRRQEILQAKKDS